MPLNNFNPKYQGGEKSRVQKRILSFQQLLDALSQKEMPSSVLDLINAEIDKANQAQTESDLTQQLKKSFYNILGIAEKELSLVAKNHYTYKWLAIGMAAFGIPFGVAFGTALDNMAFMGSGIGVGFAIGVAIGSQKDKEAKSAGKQLDVDK